MAYNEHLLVELVAEGELTHGEIAERVGASRRTVWSIANGRTRPDLQQEIADTVQGHRAATVRLAAKHMRSLLKKQIEVALEDSGETARKAREFLLKHFMQILSDEPAQAVEKRRARLDEKYQIQVERDYDRRQEDQPLNWIADETTTDTATAFTTDLSADRRDLSADRRDSTNSTDGYDNGDGVRPEANTQHSTRNNQGPSEDNGNGDGALPRNTPKARKGYDNGDGHGADNGKDGPDDSAADGVKVDPYGRLPGETIIEASRRHRREVSEAILAEYDEES